MIVSAQLDRPRQVERIRPHHSEAIVSYPVLIASFVGVLKDLRYVSDLNSSSSLQVAVGKLPQNMREHWFLFMERRTELPSLFTFCSWLESKANVQERLTSMGAEERGNLRTGRGNRW